MSFDVTAEIALNSSPPRSHVAASSPATERLAYLFAWEEHKRGLLYARHLQLLQSSKRILDEALRATLRGSKRSPKRVSVEFDHSDSFAKADALLDDLKAQLYVNRAPR